LIRDYEDAAECYPNAIWPVQAQRALRALIRAWRAARDDSQPEIFPHIAGPLIHEFRHAVLAGLSDVPRVPGPKSSTAQHPGRDLLEFCSSHQDDVLRFTRDTRIWPTNNISERGVRPVKTQQKISGRLTREYTTQDLWGSITLSRSLTCNVMAGAVAVMLLVRTRGSVRPGPFAVVFSPSSGRWARLE
jgi:transposase